MARKPKSSNLPQVNPELKGFNIEINEFGEIVSNIDVSSLNSFLDERVQDKKFRGIDVVKRDEEIQQEDTDISVHETHKKIRK